jgi:Gp19/Gp15/Gp42-like protein
MALATADDVAARLGRELDEGETLLVTTRLDDAERMLKKKITDLLERATEDDDYRKDVVQVESEMVLRLVRNPDGFSQESDGNYSYAIYQQVASGRLEVYPDEWELLDAPGSGMFIIEPVLPGSWCREGAYDWSKGPPPWWREGFIT